MRQTARIAGLGVMLLVGPIAARAQPLAPPPTAPEPEEPPEPMSADERQQALEDRLAALEEKLRRIEEQRTRPKTVVTVGGAIDLGYFVPQGDGSGFVQDYGNAKFPRYAGKYAWVFLGDILSTAVNSRGDVADLGEPPGVNRFDSIDSNGAPGFLVNEANLTTRVGIGADLLGTLSVNFTPRSGRDFAYGDSFDVDIAQLEWMPTASHDTSIFVGKFDSVLGIEYRERKAAQRFGITPSLIARYTTGTPVGLKLRSKLGPSQRIVVAAALTNGTSVVEPFHFYDEVDRNAGKTASGRLSGRLPVPGDLEIGLSGLYGPQDVARDSRGITWFWGVDARYEIGSVTAKAQLLEGHADGRAVDGAYGLDLHRGGYLEVDWMVTPLLGVLGRGELRDAFVWLGDERAYLTKSWRATGGLRVVFNDSLVGKLELLHNGEYGGIPQIRNDVLTTSLLITF